MYRYDQRGGKMSADERKMMLDGNEAATVAIQLARVGVICAYPITPQSQISERLSEMVADGELPAKYIRVESEHSAMSCVIGAMLTGVRAATATSSVGLALMHEVLGVASGCRVPAVMPVVNRALVSPWSLWCDHQDTMAERDSGWMQFYCENAQEVLDLQLIAYKVAERHDVLLPAMVCLDGFFLSHATQPVDVPSQERVDRFLPPYRTTNLYLDPNDPMFINNLTSPGEFMEMRFQQKEAFTHAPQVIKEVIGEFEDAFGRGYGTVMPYDCDDADVVLVALGSSAGTARYVANQLRARGKRVGVLKVTCFRPFPTKEVRRVLAGKKAVGILERSAGLGAAGGPLWLEIKEALGDNGPRLVDFIIGLGGRDIPETSIEHIFHRLLDGDAAQPDQPVWVDLKENPMNMRMVHDNV
jgi:pyruvate ferredoxin oxidoreductase alpha subunit